MVPVHLQAVALCRRLHDWIVVRAESNVSSGRKVSQRSQVLALRGASQAAEMFKIDPVHNER